MTLIFLFLFIILLGLIVWASIGIPGKAIKILIHILGGVVGLWLSNLLLGVFGLMIPINIFTVVLVAGLGFPGVVALAVLQILGI